MTTKIAAHRERRKHRKWLSSLLTTVMGVLLVLPAKTADILSDTGATFRFITGGFKVEDAGLPTYTSNYLTADFFWGRSCLEDVIAILDFEAPVCFMENTVTPEFAF